jgi:hypothetical protein
MAHDHGCDTAPLNKSLPATLGRWARTDHAAEIGGRASARIEVRALLADSLAARQARWQFEPSMWDALPRLSAALGATGSWAILSFLGSPHGALHGVTPR